MSKVNTEKYREILNGIKDDRELIELLIRHLCSKGTIDFREWVLFLEENHPTRILHPVELKKAA